MKNSIMKLSYTLIVTLLIILGTNSTVSASMDRGKQAFFIEKEPKEKLFKDALLSYIEPYVSQAVKDYYKEDRSYNLSNANIVNIDRLDKLNQFYFEITIEIVTSKDHKNSPYGLDKITIRKDDKGTKVVNFEHKDIEKEKDKKQFKIFH